MQEILHRLGNKKPVKKWDFNLPTSTGVLAEVLVAINSISLYFLKFAMDPKGGQNEPQV